MNVLLVDDQASVVSSLKSGIHWTELGIHNVYTALDALQARECILTHDIDILLTDIEMPVENGLSLVRWCRHEGYDFECIFLTSQADFFYAQEAIQLGSFDYILQPARYEDIVNAIQKSMARIQEKRQNKTLLDFGKVAVSQKNHLLKSILDNFLSGEECNVCEVLSALQGLNLTLCSESQVYMFQMQILGWHALPSAFPEWCDLAQDILEKIFNHARYHVLSYCPDKTSLTALIYGKEENNMSFDVYQTRINMVYTQISRRLGCSCAIYTAPAVPFESLPPCAEEIQQERRNNVLQNEGIYLYHQQDLPQTITHCDTGLLKRFSMYMINHQALKAEQEALFYLQKLNHENLLNHDTLSAFCRDYQQAAYSAAIELGLFAHSLPSYEDLFAPSENRTLTLEAASTYLKQLTVFFTSALTEEQASDSSFSKIEKYIQNNLDKTLLCSEVAKAVYLSPDYITRIVQREKGMSLKEYMTQAKMQYAQNMLLTTSLPISLIAAKVGYSNFSHFSKVYKKVMGNTPSAERGE